MKLSLLFVALATMLFSGAGAVRAAGFTYHGSLQAAGKPANGSYDIELTLYSAQTGGSVIGGPLTMYAVPVHEGSFSADADFGPLAKAFGQAYIGVKVRDAGKGEFATLDTRAAVTVNAATSCPGSWDLLGNAGNPSNYFLGTSDNQPIRFKVNGNAAGQINPGAGVSFSQAFIGATASGRDAFAVGDDVSAAGATSFAAGNVATASQAGSFMWGDSEGTTNGGIGATTAPDQFIVRATGGVGINGVPKNSDIELSIYPGASTVYNYSSVFMGNKADKGGMLISVGDESSATSNDAAFYIDQFDGTNQARKLIVNTDGLSINGSNAVDTTGHPALSVLGVPSSSFVKNVVVDFIPEGNNGYTSIFSDTIVDTGGAFVGMIFELADKNNTLYVPLSLNVATIAGNTTVTADIVGNLDVTGVASKTGGGSWAVSSDRRIKQDISPIHDALDTVMKLRPVNFRYTPEYRALEGGLADRPYAGFIAQEYADVFPSDVVSTSKHVPGAPTSDPTILALDPNPALITTVAAVQELAIENSELHKKIDDLEVRLSKLEAGEGH